MLDYMLSYVSIFRKSRRTIGNKRRKIIKNKTRKIIKNKTRKIISFSKTSYWLISRECLNYRR